MMTETEPIFFSFSSEQELADKLAENIAHLLADALTKRDKASMIVSGGSTPKPLFSQLSHTPIAWQKVSISLADERWVDTEETSSNEHLVRSLLLQDKAASARFVGLKNPSPSAREGEDQCHEDINTLPRPFDVVILGMGADGHTASLFPGSSRLSEAANMHSGRHCIAVSPPNVPFERMTMSLPTLLDSKRIFLHITGENKRKVLEKAFAEGPANEMPIRWFLYQHTTPVHIYWAP